eukprot:gnl/TRDRNA2_/TRDRNA2_125414_c1_seq1.p1 gnl/TRDRNA2_/TRDRNA2_125414_c1~~gnl/TRDRNA2_/TRDRNA2_125414_c1_seq1.p1  ORF type:complete len:407 (-),score=84.87 gnl/TRDRNA2_/TRDRNA2_125414_c1_seq1:130-1350(-)
MMSNQKFISRVTLLFSICDLNGSGEINRAEFCIGMRTLMKGISIFFSNAELPRADQLEKAADHVFAKLDEDKSGFIQHEEVLTYAYRSHELRMFMSPFPHQDQRIFEELVVFKTYNRNLGNETARSLSKEEQKLKSKLRMTPDPGGPVKRKNMTERQRMRAKERAWRQNAMLTKVHAYVLFKVFQKLQVDLQISKEQLMEATEHLNDIVVPIVQDIQGSANSKSFRSPDIDPSEEFFTRTAHSVGNALAQADFQQRVHELEEQQVSLREFCSLIYPHVKEAEIEACMRHCHLFRAHDILTELLEAETTATADGTRVTSTKLDVDDDDIDALFQAIDSNGDGHLSIEELCKVGGLELREAQKLVEMWDRDRSGQLSRGETLSIIYNMHSIVRCRMKGFWAERSSEGF